jgi:hypothetical protein
LFIFKATDLVLVEGLGSADGLIAAAGALVALLGLLVGVLLLLGAGGAVRLLGAGDGDGDEAEENCQLL